jgi:hypothetical protein
MKITYPEHCGNSPKKILLINIYKAITESDDIFILNNLDEDIILNIIGDRKIVGKGNIILTINVFIEKGLNEIRINDAITHGNTAAVHGSAFFNDNLQIDFCDVYKFNGFGKNSKIKEVNSYLINISNHKIF